jgi:hypothetical protein
VGNEADYGGAVYVTGDGHFEMNGGVFRGNLANFRGGAIFVHSGTMILNDGSVSENRAVKNGGGINISGESILEIRGGSVIGNTAGAWSGGIENFGMFDMYGGIISGNSASNDAGGVYNGGVFTMHGGEIRENSATYGGGVCNDGKMTIHDGKILANLAQESGGGIYNADRLVINGGKIASNTAVTSGGGIENDGTFFMYDGVIGGLETSDANEAYLGGGVCVYSGSFTMYGGRIEKNTGVDGGGVENEASFVMKGGVITQNFASMQGGGITNRGELILKDHASVIGNGSGTGAIEHKGGGIYWLVSEKSSISMEGAVRVTNNTTNGETANLVIYGDGRISVLSLSDGSCIGLTLLNKNKKETAGAVIRYTGDENVKNFSAYFSSDNPFYIMKVKNSEIRLSEKNIGLAVGLLAGFGIAIITGVTVTIFCSRRKSRKYKH